MKLSLIVPSYNEEENVKSFYEAVKTTFDGQPYEYEIIFVNDGSKDCTLKEMKKLYKEDEDHVRIISFSRNFGKEAAILAGMRRASGDYVTLIDADLQQRPEIARDMVGFLEQHEEFDCVAAYQEKRRESHILKLFKKLFYHIMDRTSDVRFVDGASDFRTFRKAMVETIMALPEYFRFSKGIFSWVGYETYYIPYQVEERNAGKSKWNFVSLVRYAIEGFISFSTFPLKIATFLGTLTSGGAILYLIVVIFEKLLYDIDVPGYPTIISLILLIGGIQLLILGIMGEYLSRIYVEGKNRPIYIEKEVLLGRKEE